MGPFVRVLYGDISSGQLNEHFRKSRTRRYCPKGWPEEEIFHYVLGYHNAEFLRKYGFKRIKLVDELSEVHPLGVSHFYNKAFLLAKAAEDFSEFVAIDFDTKIRRTPDKKFWELLRSKEGLGGIQCPFVKYRRPQFPHRGLSYEKRSERRRYQIRGINTSFIHCTNPLILKSSLENFIPYNKMYGEKGDETVLLYTLEDLYGEMEQDELISNFDPLVAHVCGVGSGVLTREGKDIYFSHL